MEKSKLSPLQFKVTQENATEAPFKNEYWDNKKEGIYVDIVSGEALFSSLTKFKSGTGWPSFYAPLESKNIVEKKDKGFFSTRIEIRSKHGNSHLGHVFNDGPNPSGLRYCMNSAAMKFIPKEHLKEQGFEKYLSLFKFDEKTTAEPGEKLNEKKIINGEHQLKDKNFKKAYLAGGCFWGVEAILEKQKGIKDVISGYMGGKNKNPTYHIVSSGNSGHAEAVEVTFDSTIISFEEILGIFWRLHDPTQLNRQGPDVGTQYRSAIFYTDDRQKIIAQASKSNFDKSGVFKNSAVTEIVQADTFYPAESYHQNYFSQNGRICHRLRSK